MPFNFKVTGTAPSGRYILDQSSGNDCCWYLDTGHSVTVSLYQTNDCTGTPYDTFYARKKIALLRGSGSWEVYVYGDNTNDESDSFPLRLMYATSSVTAVNDCHVGQTVLDGSAVCGASESNSPCVLPIGSGGLRVGATGGQAVIADT